MRGDERFAFADRLAAYKAHPQAHVRRDPHNDQVIGRELWANGGVAGRML